MTQTISPKAFRSGILQYFPLPHDADPAVFCNVYRCEEVGKLRSLLVSTCGIDDDETNPRSIMLLLFIAAA